VDREGTKRLVTAKDADILSVVEAYKTEQSTKKTRKSLEDGLNCKVSGHTSDPKIHDLVTCTWPTF